MRKPETHARRLLRLALISAAIHTFIFLTTLVPFYAVFAFSREIPFYQRYGTAFWQMKEIMVGYVVIIAICRAISKSADPEE